MTKKKLLEKPAGNTDLSPSELSSPVIRRVAVAAMLAAGAFSPSLEDNQPGLRVKVRIPAAG